MFRLCLLLGLAAPVWATPITGRFDISADSNFADILGDGFAWQFHQGNAGPVFTVCPGNACSLDGSAAPASFALLNSNNWFRAANGSAESSGNLKPGQTTGGISGSFSWHVSRTDWSDVPAGSMVALTVPMDISGVLTATNAAGNQFMEAKLTASGNFETTVMRTGDNVTFFGAAGAFDGTVTSPDDPVQTATGEPAPVAASASGSDPGQGAGTDQGAVADPAAGSVNDAGPASGSETTVPEPATYLLIGIGLASLAVLHRRLA